MFHLLEIATLGIATLRLYRTPHRKVNVYFVGYFSRFNYDVFSRRGAVEGGECCPRGEILERIA
jgi:hypothetical protein